jgi:glycosyltransferase involved in cell wall biosynthesis
MLHPSDEGGKAGTYQMLKRLKRKHEVTFLALAQIGEHPESRKLASEYCQQLIAVPFKGAGRFSRGLFRSLMLNFSSPLPYAVEKYRSTQMRQEIAREAREHRYDVVVSDSPGPALNMPGGIRSAKVLFQQNVECEMCRRRYEKQSNPVKRTYFRTQWQKMVSFESATCKNFDAVVAVSESDRDFIRSRFRANEVYDVPTGVDTEYFSPLGLPRSEAEIVFAGSMDLATDGEAIGYFAREVLPLIAAVIPDAKLTIVNTGQSQQLRTPGLPAAVTVVNSVDDARPYVDRASAYIAPSRQGGSTRRRILEAMAMRKPVVSTSLASEGLPARDGDDLLIADNPRSFADAVIKLLTDGGFAERVGKRARSLVTGHFSWERAASVFSAVCEDAARKRARAAGA